MSEKQFRVQFTEDRVDAKRLKEALQIVLHPTNMPEDERGKYKNNGEVTEEKLELLRFALETYAAHAIDQGSADVIEQIEAFKSYVEGVELAVIDETYRDVLPKHIPGNHSTRRYRQIGGVAARFVFHAELEEAPHTTREPKEPLIEQANRLVQQYPSMRDALIDMYTDGSLAYFERGFSAMSARQAFASLMIMTEAYIYDDETTGKLVTAHTKGATRRRLRDLQEHGRDRKHETRDDKTAHKVLELLLDPRMVDGRPTYRDILEVGHAAGFDEIDGEDNVRRVTQAFIAHGLTILSTTQASESLQPTTPPVEQTEETPKKKPVENIGSRLKRRQQIARDLMEFGDALDQNQQRILRVYLAAGSETTAAAQLGVDKKIFSTNYNYALKALLKAKETSM